MTPKKVFNLSPQYDGAHLPQTNRLRPDEINTK